MTARAHAGSRSVWNGAAFCGRARLTTWWRSRWRSSAVFCPASLGAIHRRRGGRRRSDDVFWFAVGDGCDSIANATASGSLPADLAAAHAMILAERAARPEAEARIANARRSRADRLLQACDREAAPAALRLRARSVRRGSSSRWSFSWKSWRPLATEDELAAEQAAAQTQTVRSFQRKRPSREPVPDHLPRGRVVIPAPESCACCRSSKLAKLGEDITETLEVIPRQWKVIQTVRETFSCRNCETITQPAAPSRVTRRGFGGPDLLSVILFGRFRQRRPLNRQSERYRREGSDLSVSTLADQVGAGTIALQPLFAQIERPVLAAERLHGDDTNVPILAKGQTIKGHIPTYVRDDRPFGGRVPPAALHDASRDRRREHPTRHLAGFSGIPQADAYSPPRTPNHDATARQPARDTTAATTRS